MNPEDNEGEQREEDTRTYTHSPTLCLQAIKAFAESQGNSPKLMKSRYKRLCMYV